MQTVDQPVNSVEIAETKLAYYSLLQYEPDRARQERLNVAVLLEAPGYEFRAAKFLRYMKPRMRELDPTLSEELVYAYAKSLEDSFNSMPEDLGRRPLEFNYTPKPVRLLDLCSASATSAYTLWRFTEPKALVIDAYTTFDQALEKLYRRLVQAKGAPQDEPAKDKEYVRKTAVSAMQQRRVALVENPPPLEGREFLENSFDAGHLTSFAAYLQFLSFDTTKPALDQTKAFITARRDVGDVVDNRAVEYVAIVQPPEGLRTTENRQAHGRAQMYLQAAGIRYVPVADQSFDIVAHALSGAHDDFRHALSASLRA